MWQKIAKVSEVPEGEGKVVQCAGPTLALFKKNGKIYALDNTCPHRGGPLGEGSLDGMQVVCPWHAWSFDISTGRCLTAPDLVQKVFPSKVEGADILVDF